MMRDKSLNEELIIKSLKVFKYTIFLLLSAYTLLYFLTPFVFDSIYGEKVISQTMSTYITNTTNPDEKALAIMGWEKQYFYNPYSL